MAPSHIAALKFCNIALTEYAEEKPTNKVALYNYAVKKNDKYNCLDKYAFDQPTI